MRRRLHELRHGAARAARGRDDLRAPRHVFANFDEKFVEAAFDRVGLVVDQKDTIGTEWREYEEERTQPVSRDLLRLARLRRRRDEIVAQYGEEVYDVAEASLQWRPYQLLGKLRPTMYVLSRGK